MIEPVVTCSCPSAPLRASALTVASGTGAATRQCVPKNADAKRRRDSSGGASALNGPSGTSSMMEPGPILRVVLSNDLKVCPRSRCASSHPA